MVLPDDTTMSVDSDGEDYVFSEGDEDDDDWSYLCMWFLNMMSRSYYQPQVSLTELMVQYILSLLHTKQFFLETTIYLWRFTLCCNPIAGNVVSQYYSQSMEMWF